MLERIILKNSQLSERMLTELNSPLPAKQNTDSLLTHAQTSSLKILDIDTEAAIA